MIDQRFLDPGAGSTVEDPSAPIADVRFGISKKSARQVKGEKISAVFVQVKNEKISAVLLFKSKAEKFRLFCSSSHRAKNFGCFKS